MILYNQNPNLNLSVVVTISGKKEYRKNCRLVGGNYYAIGVDIFKIENKWFKKDSPELILDHEKGTYHLNNHGMISGVVAYDKVRGLINGCYTPNKYKNITLWDGLRSRNCICEDILAGSPYSEDIAQGIWTSAKKNKTIVNLLNHNDKGYNIEDNHYDKLLKTYEEKPYKLNLAHAKIANLLRDTTFGIELESCAGNLPQHLLNRTGTAICKDGSLKDERGMYPPEYVTVPLKGAKGISNAIELCEYLSPRNMMDIKCSYHLHLGGFTTSRLFLVSLHSLCYKIQGDIFKMFPSYKLHNEGFKEKNYCKVLPKVIIQYTKKKDYAEYINSSYTELYKYLSDNGDRRVSPCRECNRTNKVHYGREKWNKVARYHWLNMINSIFSNRNTLEFRLHTPTFNSTKVINWLLICNAICKYAEKYPMACITNEKVTFEDVLNFYRDNNTSSEYSAFVSRYLIAYVKQRNKVFAEDKKKGDLLSTHEFESDKNYTFELEGRRLI